MTIRAAVWFVALLAAGIAASAGAQGPPVYRNTLRLLLPGDTLKVWAIGPRLDGATGILTRLGPDTLAMDRLSGRVLTGGGLAVPIRFLTRVDVNQGKRRSGLRTAFGVVLGAAGGAVVGSVLGTVLECGNTCGDNGDLEGLRGFLLGGAVGIVGGGVTGWFIGSRPYTHWQIVVLSR